MTVYQDRWLPKQGETMFFVDTEGMMVSDIEYYGGEVVKALIACGNYFRTREEAEYVAAQLRDVIERYHGQFMISEQALNYRKDHSYA